MKQLVTNTSSKAFIGAALVAAFLVIGASAASAATQALVTLDWRNSGSNLGTYAIYSGTGIATVGTTANTPSVMWAAGQVAGTATQMWTNPPQTVYSTRSIAYNLASGHLQKSHPYAPTGMITIVPATKATTICMGGNDPGGCTDRPGTMQVTPGTRKYGGTARMVFDSVGHAKYGATVGYSIVDFSAMAVPGTGFASHYYWHGGVTFVNTLFPSYPAYMTMQQFDGPTTTGVVRAYNTRGYVTTETQTGSFNLNTANLTGMISVVRPHLLYSYIDAGGGTFGGTAGVASAASRTTITFLPEPGQLTVLGLGILSLAGLHRLRRR